MRLLPLLLLLAACRTTSPPPVEHAPSPTWTWAAVEYFGPVARAEVLAELPIALGSQRTGEELQTLVTWCGDFAEARGLAWSECSELRYGDGRAIVLVELGRSGPTLRPAPTGASEGPADVLEVYVRLRARQSELFEAQSQDGLLESFEAGYLSWSDPQLSELAAELARITPPHREALVALTLGAADPASRARAGTLLNWAGDHPLSIPAVLPALADPDDGVRNNVSRYYLHAFKTLDDPAAVPALVEALVAQADLPDMSDRNKALYSLLQLARRFPEARGALAVAIPVARRIAQTSILPNVAGAARDLLAELGQPPPRPPEGSLAGNWGVAADLPAWLTAYVDAFNRHDPEAMAASCQAELEVWYVDEAGVSGLGTSGPDALAAELRGYFEAYPDVRSVPEQVQFLDGFLWFRERVSWADRSQASRAVYQVQGGKLLRAWYLPLEPDSPESP